MLDFNDTLGWHSLPLQDRLMGNSKQTGKRP
jgi:hypothetical protein